jgi:TIGR02611 family protein
MNRRPHGTGDDDNVTLDAADDDWQWRRKIRSNPHSHLVYRVVVGVIGLIIVVLGLMMVPFPGPGWLVVFLGLAIWASEFEWAQRLLRLARHTLQGWTEWLRPQPWWVKGLVLLLTIAAVAAIFWLLLLVSGVPGYFPDVVEEWLKKVPGLGP